MNDPFSLRTDQRLLLQLTLCATLCAASVAATNAADANSDALKQQIVAQARTVSPDDYAFTRTSKVEQIEGDKTEQRVIVDRWDPTKPAAQRWSLVSIDGHPPKAKELKAYTTESAKRRVPSYGRVASYFGGTSTKSVDSRGRTVYRFACLTKQ